MSDEIRALSKERPVLIVVEDAHWIDASTLAALEACFDKISSERVLILITARPTFVHRFGGHPIVNHLTLNRLGIAQAAAVLSKIAGGKSLPDELVREIAARTPWLEGAFKVTQAEAAPTILAPELLGRTVEEVLQLSESASWRVEVSSLPSDARAVGQMPAAGTPMPPDARLQLAWAEALR